MKTGVRRVTTKDVAEALGISPRWCRQIISAHNEIHLICTAARKERLRFA